MKISEAEFMRIKRSANGSLAEFPLAIFLLLVLFLFPLINLLGVAAGAASGYLVTRECAAVASTQLTYSGALTGVQSMAIKMLNQSLLRFMRMTPVGGYQSCGVDLYTVATDFHTNVTKEYGPNVPAPAPIDTLSKVYESSAHSTFDIGPMINMSGLPWLSTVPGVGRPARISFRVERAIEHPNGFDRLDRSAVIGSSMPARLNTVPTATFVAGPDGSDWNYPTIYQMIAAAGRTVITQDVLTVQANNPNWTVSSAVCSAGQQVWIDTHADGQWTIQQGVFALTDANGSPAGGSYLNTGILSGALMSQVGNNGPIFLAGKTLLNYQAPTAGPVEFLMADGPGANFYADNGGTMTVRVIITQ